MPVKFGLPLIVAFVASIDAPHALVFEFDMSIRERFASISEPNTVIELLVASIDAERALNPPLKVGLPVNFGLPVNCVSPESVMLPLKLGAPAKTGLPAKTRLPVTVAFVALIELSAALIDA